MRSRYAAFETSEAAEFFDDLSVEISDRSSYGAGCHAVAGLYYEDDIIGTEISLDDEELVPPGLSNHDVTEERIVNSIKHV